MNVNDDFSKRVVMHGDSIEWESSPMPGVDRRRLDRVEGENERVTTIVRYAAGSQFSSHVHGGGEEFIVLDGVFEDDYGAWPQGSYIRNPPGSKHTPGSALGCTIFVKLWQFDPDDRTFIHTNINKLGAIDEAHRPGVSASPLFRDDSEDVRFERWSNHSTIEIDNTGGAEIFVIDGIFRQAEDTFQKLSWLRLPPGGPTIVSTGDDQALVWIKTGHLRQLVAPVD